MDPKLAFPAPSDHGRNPWRCQRSMRDRAAACYQVVPPEVKDNLPAGVYRDDLRRNRSGPRSPSGAERTLEDIRAFKLAGDGGAFGEAFILEARAVLDETDAVQRAIEFSDRDVVIEAKHADAHEDVAEAEFEATGGKCPRARRRFLAASAHEIRTGLRKMARIMATSAVALSLAGCAESAVEVPPTDAHAAVLAFAAADLRRTPEAIDAFLAADLSTLTAAAGWSGQSKSTFAVTCAGVGTWGDVTGDAVSNIIDAQQVARFVTGLWPSRPELIGNADVLVYGVITIVDAQQIARYSVGLPTESRAGQNRCE